MAPVAEAGVQEHVEHSLPEGEGTGQEPTEQASFIALQELQMRRGGIVHSNQSWQALN